MNIFDVVWFSTVLLVGIQPLLDAYHFRRYPDDCGKEDCEPCRFFNSPRYASVCAGSVDELGNKDKTGNCSCESDTGGDQDIHRAVDLNIHSSSPEKFKILSSFRQLSEDSLLSFLIGALGGVSFSASVFARFSS